MTFHVLKQRSVLSLAVFAVFLTGCAVGPNYRRPNVNVPGAFRAASSEAVTAPDASSLGDQKWSEVFQDERLQELVRAAIQQNYDVRIGAARILQAEARLGITRADELPTVGGNADITGFRSPSNGPIPGFQRTRGQVSLSAAWELDFWGKYRRATEAARADLLGTEWARRAVITTLVADLANSYFVLRELDLELEISQRTLASRQESLLLIQDLADRGLSSLLDVRQAEQLVFTAGARIPDLERQIQQEENFISVLVGNNPEVIPRGRVLTEQPHASEVPAGLPSALLGRRPDIQQAEQQLIAFNARIGVAKAQYFPQITLTGTGGFQSAALTNLFSGPAGLWNVAGGLTQPIFSGGRIRSGVRLAEAQEQEALLTYQQKIQQAFREVSDALVGYRKSQEFRQQQEQLAGAAQEASQLSDQRYRGGVTSYLEVLTNETNYFSAELGLAEARAAELEALVQLYRALGGGWQQ
jgi:multidrug efflux system outer membrane protein